MTHPPLQPDIPGGVGAPDAPAAPAGPPAAIHRPTTYRELLSDETLSPTRERLANYFQGYRFEGGALSVSTALREQTVVVSDRQPMIFLCLLVAGHNKFPEVTIMHRMMRYVDMPGEDASGFHDRYLGLHCRRRATHVPFASAEERTRLLTFCREHLAAPAAGGTCREDRGESALAHASEANTPWLLNAPP